MPAHALLIDDLDEAAGRLSPLGQLLLSDSVLQLRGTLYRHAESNGWRVMSYATFVHWSVPLADAAFIVVADKLYPASRLCGPVVRWDAHRYWAGEASERELSVQSAPVDVPPHSRITIIDDATWSGTTMRDVCRQAERRGGTVTHIIVGVASDRAAEMLAAAGPRVSVLTRVPVDWDIQHARDFCPWLPCSGRRIRSNASAPAAGIEIRLAPLFYNAGSWLQLTPDDPCWNEASRLALGFIPRFEAHLGRRALVRDLALLGPEAPLPVHSPNWPAQHDVVNAPLWDTIGRREGQ